MYHNVLINGDGIITRKVVEIFSSNLPILKTELQWMRMEKMMWSMILSQKMSTIMFVVAREGPEQGMQHQH